MKIRNLIRKMIKMKSGSFLIFSFRTKHLMQNQNDTM